MISTTRFVAALALSAAGAWAQATAESASSSAPVPAKPGDSAVVLSPFEVSASNDVGYIATNSLAGSRLNSALKDTPAVIDVFTKEFLADLGATDLSQAMDYANNSQEDTGDTQRVINGNEQLNPGAPFQFRSRGLPSTRARDYFDTRLSTQLYVVERLDESRGPNSVLFGIGSAGGIVNSTTKRASLGQSFVETNLQAGTYRLLYTALDVNRPLIRDTLGMRLNVLRSQQGNWRDYISNRKEGIHGAVTYRPFKNTEFRAEYETGEHRGTLTRNYPARDQITRWWEAGSSTSSSLGGGGVSAAETASGFTRLSTASRIVYVPQQGYLIDARNSLTTTGLAQGHVLLDEARMPFTANVSGPGARSKHDYELYSAVVEHRFLPKLFGELAMHHEEGDWLNFDSGNGDANTVNGDPNALLRNPTTFQSLTGFRPATDAAGNLVNPNAGRTYTEVGWRRRSSVYERDALRASLAYELDLGRFGSHRFASMAQRQITESDGGNEREVWLGAPFNADPTHDNNTVWRRTYVTLGQSDTFAVPDHQSTPSLTMNYPGLTAPLQSGWVQISTLNRSEQKIESGLLAMQSYWLQRRVVTTVGYRVDRLSETRTPSEREKSGIWANSNGIWVLNPAAKETFEFEGSTKTVGLVLHPWSWLSVFANGAENLGLPNFGQRIGPDGILPPPPRARGYDAGVTIEALRGKLITRLSYYKTNAADQINGMGVPTAFTPRYNSVIAILDDPNGDRDTSDRIYTPAQMAAYSELRPLAVATVDTLDNISSGYEARITANLAAGLRFILNYSYTKPNKTDSYPHTKLLWEQVYAFVADLQKANPNVDVNALTGGGGTPLSQILATQVTDLAGRAADFEESLGNREHKANIFGNYSFQTPRLKGLVVGGGARYMSAINAGLDNLDNKRMGSDSFFVDAMARYPLRFSVFDRKIRASVQVNVRNLLNDRDPQIYRYAGNSNTTVSRMNFVTPREVVLSVNAKF